MNNIVYLIPGRGNKLSEIGDIITSLGFDIYGREILPPFSNLRFSEQLTIIKNDLIQFCWNSKTKLVGHSYGAYLLLHSLSELEAFPGKILLFSPVLGAALSNTILYGSRPPRADRLLKIAKEKKFPPPKSLKIYTGENDDGCDPVLASKFCSLIPNSKVNIVKDQGHKLDSEFVKKSITHFLEIAIL